MSRSTIIQMTLFFEVERGHLIMKSIEMESYF